MNLFKKIFFVGVLFFVILSQVLSKAVSGVFEEERCGEENGGGVCPEGYCCSKEGWCGHTDFHCAVENGCQSMYGLCHSESSDSISDPDDDDDGKALMKRGYNIKSYSTTISNLDEAIAYYRKKSGKTAAAKSSLIKNSLSFKNEMTKLEKKIKKKITDKKIKNGQLIKNSKGSYIGLWCLTLGSYRLDLEYSFKPKKGNNKVKIHFWGKNRWDFEKVKFSNKNYLDKADVLKIKKSDSYLVKIEKLAKNLKKLIEYDIKKSDNILSKIKKLAKNFGNLVKKGAIPVGEILYNLVEEYFPSKIAGKGKPYDIVYDFNYEMNIKY